MATTPNRRRNDPDDSEAHVHRRRSDTDAVLQMHSRLDDHDGKFIEVFEILRGNADSLAALNANVSRVADVLEAMANFKGFWMTLRLLSAAAKIIIPIIAVIGALWIFLKTGQWQAR